MKNIKLRIVYLILGAALLLFALFMLAVNLIIPAHFVSEAKKALISEAQYQNRTIPYTDDEPIYDEGEDEGNFFTPSIVFLELDDGYRPNTWNRDTYRLEIKLLEYCAGRDIALNQCYTFKTDKHHLIFMSVEEEQDDWEKPYAYIMYIDIGPITRYIVTLNWAFFGVLLAISSVMCLLGFRFGRDIEKETERQQTFFQNASHELKTPLAVIQNYGSLLQDPALPKEQRVEYAKAVTDASRRLADLIANILKLNKLENQQIFPQAETYDLGEQLRECLLGFEDAWEAKELAVEADIPDGVAVRTDRELLTLVWNNLFSNAVKFTDAGGSIHVFLRHTGTQAEVCVTDTGCGMSPETGRHIFEKFYQGDSSHATQGNGLGLALVRRVVDIVGGEIAVKSTLGKGTTFWFIATDTK